MMQKYAGDATYREILKTLAGYFQGGSGFVNFEHIYHCAQELLSTFKPIPHTVNEYRPILQPFINRPVATNRRALRALVESMAKFIFEELSRVCDDPKTDLGLMTHFLDKLRQRHITRIYTTNYDDFILQAAPDLYMGFDHEPSLDAKRFDRDSFWQATNVDCVFHLHGSVHLAFESYDYNAGPTGDIGDLYWYDCRSSALTNSSFHGSGNHWMDGRQVVRTALTTGLDKLSLLQQRPLSHYYASMARDAMTADAIYVIGYGLGDVHLNIWLAEARRRKPKPPILFVDKWPDSFLSDTAFEKDYKIIQMLHALHMRVGEPYGGEERGSGWTLSKDRDCAVWDKGFLAFLKASSELDDVLAELG